jgi:hypothetical protein
MTRALVALVVLGDALKAVRESEVPSAVALQALDKAQADALALAVELSDAYPPRSPSASTEPPPPPVAT